MSRIGRMPVAIPAGVTVDIAEGNKVTVAVSSAFAKALIEKSYMSLLMDTLSEVSETNLVIELVLADDIKKDNPPIITESKKASFFKNSVLKPNYTFETFVVGPSNREAQQAALMIASNPGKFYNPLFLYSSSGLGKTHLLHAIGNYIKEERKKAGLTQEEFAMRSGLGLRFVRELEQGKETVRMDKVNQALAMFGKEAVPGEKEE